MDRGFTYTIAAEEAAWEATLDEKGPDARALIEAQLGAYELVLDVATTASDLTEAWIRRLHEELCRPQDTYEARTPQGPSRITLPKGEYKKYPNHVLQPDGTEHAYAPVNDTASEMTRLVQELRSPAFTAAHPVLQAAYAHYFLVAVHPFADGNGRVARAMASVYTYRGHISSSCDLRGSATAVPGVAASRRYRGPRLVHSFLDRPPSGHDCRGHPAAPNSQQSGYRAHGHSSQGIQPGLRWTHSLRTRLDCAASAGDSNRRMQRAPE
ncbi:MAG: Fic family protein [Actinobacteria bacterium]|nr:Fic family protein [Actinomycetota bacterium]